MTSLLEQARGSCAHAAAATTADSWGQKSLGWLQMVGREHDSLMESSSHLHLQEAECAVGDQCRSELAHSMSLLDLDLKSNSFQIFVTACYLSSKRN